MIGFGPDGPDGPTEVAGALVDGQSISRAQKKWMSHEAALREKNRYRFFIGRADTSSPDRPVRMVNDWYRILAL